MSAENEQVPAPEWLEHLSVLRVEPGDKLVLRHPMRLSFDAARRLQEQASKFFGCPVVVLEEGMELGVVRGATA